MPGRTGSARGGPDASVNCPLERPSTRGVRHLPAARPVDRHSLECGTAQRGGLHDPEPDRRVPYSRPSTAPNGRVQTSDRSECCSASRDRKCPSSTRRIRDEGGSGPSVRTRHRGELRRCLTSRSFVSSTRPLTASRVRLANCDRRSRYPPTMNCGTQAITFCNPWTTKARSSTRICSERRRTTASDSVTLGR